MIDRGKHNVLGVLVDAVDYAAAVERVIDAARGRRPMAVSALAVHGVMTGALDPVHRYRLNSFDLLVPDGQPVRWALNWLHGTALPDRVYGPTLMLKLCERAAREGMSIWLFGGTPELLRDLRLNLERRFPRLSFAGVEASRFRRMSPPERDQLVARVRDSRAAIAFVGLGCPRQEVWSYEFREALSMPVIAVGAAFNFHAGHLEQAPRFLQDHGLEWIFRLLHEPARLWKRYLMLNPLFVSLLLLQLTRLRRFDPAAVSRPTEEILHG